VTAAAIPVTAPTPVWHLYRALVGIGIVCGFLIVATFEFTRPIIQKNQIALRQQAVREVLKGATQSRTFRYSEATGSYEPVPPDTSTGDLAFAGFDANGRLVGIALEAQGQGYADVVRILYGYSPDLQAVTGIKVLDSRETPGLGDRVETDPAYQLNFRALDVTLAADGGGLAHPIEFVKSGMKQQGCNWQIDGITGATITSRAIATMIGRSTEQWIARVARNRAAFQPESGTPEK
jgi:electron transport complex protein RnfG